MFILWYVVVLSGIAIIQMVIALFVIPSYIKRVRNIEYKLMGGSPHMIPITVLSPAHNEEVTIVESIRSLINLNYSNFEVVVINDGSTDNTLQKVISAFDLHPITYPYRERLVTQKVRAIYYNPDLPRLRLIDKENGGKSDALNAGINLSRYPYIVSLDADSLLEGDALLRIAMAFIKDKHTVAVGGIIRIANGCKISNGKVLSFGLPQNLWAKFQTIEYFRSFLVGRIGWNSVNSLLIISGAFGAFQKEPVIQVGGYANETVGEDMELVLKLHRYMKSKKYRYRVNFLPDPICWTQVPETLKVLYQQRRRWQIGLMDVMSRNKDMFLKPRFGVLGMVAMPYFFLFETISPIVEILGYLMLPLAWYFGFLSMEALILFFLAAVVFGVIVSTGSLMVEEFTNSRYIKVRDVLLLSFLSLVENAFYRQMTVIFRLLGIFSYRKYRHSWGVMKRQKFTEEDR